MKAAIHSYSWSNFFVAFVPTDNYELKRSKTSNNILHFLQVKKKIFKSHMLFKSWLMNPHKNNSNSHSYLKDKTYGGALGYPVFPNPFSHVYTSFVGSLCSAHLQTHPNLQWATTAAKHQLCDDAARTCWDGWRQHDTECKDPVPQQVSTTANVFGNQRYSSLFT